MDGDLTGITGACSTVAAPTRFTATRSTTAMRISMEAIAAAHRSPAATANCADSVPKADPAVRQADSMVLPSVAEAAPSIPHRELEVTWEPSVAFLAAVCRGDFRPVAAPVSEEAECTEAEVDIPAAVAMVAAEDAANCCQSSITSRST